MFRERRARQKHEFESLKCSASFRNAFLPTINKRDIKNGIIFKWSDSGIGWILGNTVLEVQITSTKLPIKHQPCVTMLCIVAREIIS